MVFVFDWEAKVRLWLLVVGVELLLWVGRLQELLVQRRPQWCRCRVEAVCSGTAVGGSGMLLVQGQMLLRLAVCVKARQSREVGRLGRVPGQVGGYGPVVHGC